MSIHVTTAILDLHQPLSEQHKRNLEATLKADAGVLSVGSPRPSAPAPDGGLQRHPYQLREHRQAGQ